LCDLDSYSTGMSKDFGFRAAIHCDTREALTPTKAAN
jgi:hypothetical protein